MKIIVILFFLLFQGAAAAKISVVTTLTDYAVITKNLAKDKADVFAIVGAGEDPHHVRPKPSFAVKMAHADLFITTGLDLELWVPSLINRAGNPAIRSGQNGYVAAASQIPLLDKPTNFSHSEGGLHIYGNPHIMTSPLNMLYIADNIAIGLTKVDPINRKFYLVNLKKFKMKLMQDCFGKELISLLGEQSLRLAAERGVLYKILREKNLLGHLHGWFKEVLPIVGRKIVSYHKNWTYLIRVLHLQSIETIEVKPGVPPTPSHVISVIKSMKNNDVKIILGASYFSEQKMKMVSKKVDAKLIIFEMGSRLTDKSIMDKFFRWAKFLH